MPELEEKKSDNDSAEADMDDIDEHNGNDQNSIDDENPFRSDSGVE